MVSKLYVSDGSIGFANGRHRTKWQIRSGYASILVSIQDTDVAYAKKIGLVIREVSESDFLVVKLAPLTMRGDERW
ncbi:MAG: hypothetical protein HOP02_14400 [Methylococcaceae bacterium]|nr:hypothetical protein [Methylococcaceae bacterium]